MFELYVSTDVETDGHIPGPHSMLSLGSAARRGGTSRNHGMVEEPGRSLGSLPHTHRALDDAIEQGALFCNMLIENQRAR